ncbi:hypothetical protein AURDEDRAFT_28217, partial [Auricularia subglabra TFB-10046 SS5]
GYKLNIITQKHAYRILRDMKPPERRQGTSLNIGRIRAAVAEATGHWPSEQELWETTRMKDFHKPVREFILRTMHNMQCIGNYWRNIPHREMLGECPPCETLESMDHILFECTAPGQEAIWREVRVLWSRTGLQWPGVNFGTTFGCGKNFGTTFGCGKMTVCDQDGHVLPGPSRLFRILTSEAAFLIWKIRNERRIQNKDDPEKHVSETEIINRFRSTIERRFRVDVNMTNRKRYKSKALKWKTMAQTWERVL